ncbi:MAG: rod shape-determining protein RodA [Alphaproteobacteria bacterium]|nr:rod shape-determining protein RodA [Alphaproteobacteria bacterium]
MPYSYSSHSPKENKLAQVNWLIVSLILVLGGLGVAMLYSAAGGSMEPWASRQAIRFAVAFIGMMIIAVFPNRLLMRYAYLFYFLSLALLMVVELMGSLQMGAQRWISVGGLNLQPSEIMKMALTLALARYYHGMLAEDVSRPIMLIPPLTLIAMPVILILLQPNLGTATITAAIGVCILFTAGLYWRYFIAVGLVLMAAIPVGWHFLHDYQKQRVTTFLNPEADPLGAGYNIMQSKIAIGSGGLFGTGFMKGTQSQLDFLPEKHTDFIFTTIAEEFGFVGATGVIGIYLLLIILGVATAIRSRSRFGALVALGVTSMLLLHVAINIGMVMGLLPVVGVPLPLLSYGGTMVFAMMFGFGLLLNSYVHRDVTLGKVSHYRL